jgi:hypothetical protein
MNNLIQYDSQENKKAISLIEGLSRIGDVAPLIEQPKTEAITHIYNELTNVFKFLGHTAIFKGDAVDQQVARQQISEMATNILEGFRNNKQFRRFTHHDFSAIIKKGCASEFAEIKTCSPSSIFQWSKEFHFKYFQEIAKNRAEYVANAGIETDPNEQERKGNLYSVDMLFKSLSEPDYGGMIVHGGWIARGLCGKYHEYLPKEFLEQFSKRKDLYKQAKEDYSEMDSNSVMFNKKNPIENRYCALILKEFKEVIEFEGEEYYKEIIERAINNYHDKN